MNVDLIDEGDDDVNGDDGNDVDDIDNDAMPSPPPLIIICLEDINAAPPLGIPSPNTAELPPDAEPACLPPLS